MVSWFSRSRLIRDFTEWYSQKIPGYLIHGRML